MARDWNNIDWSNRNAKVAAHFRVHEALWLPSWRVYHEPSDEEKEEIVKTASAMEKIRKLVDKPIDVHCWIRPLRVNAPGTERHGGNYNRAIGSRATKSAHIFGRAVDFHVSGHQGPDQCARIRKRILPNLEEWDIRMEDIDGGWIQIDTNPVGHSRFFKP